jgi:hypothetical protein
MNEIIFLLHVLLILGVSLGALRMGKEALVALSALFCVIANVFILKQTNLFGLDVTCCDAYSVGSVLCLNLIQKYFGKSSAKQAMHIAFISLVCFSLFAMIQLWYAPCNADSSSSHFVAILKSSPRITAASLVTFYIVQRFDIFLFGWLGKLTLSLLISQLLDTLIFSILGLYGLVESVFDIFIMSFAIKCIAILIMGPLTAFSKFFLKKENYHA